VGAGSKIKDAKRAYLVREELQREKLRGRSKKKAWGFENKLDEGGRSERERL